MKNRVLALLCLLVLLVGIAAPALAMPSDHVYYVYTSNGKSLNMRESPVTNSDNLVTRIPFGEKVTVSKLVQNGTWAYIHWDGSVGYVQTRYLVDYQPSSPSAATTEDPALEEELKSIFSGFTAQNYDVLVRSSTPGSYVNLRWGPSMKIAVQERVNDGSTLHVLAHNKHWAQVQDPATGVVGFMYRSFLTTVVLGD